jgi:hypothetical protein
MKRHTWPPIEQIITATAIEYVIFGLSRFNAALLYSPRITMLRIIIVFWLTTLG